jgi:acetyl-CoA carboxylase biotin carboxyl carrier protein
MKFNDIKELIEIFNNSNLTKLNIEEDKFKIELDKTASTVVAAAPVATTAPVAPVAVPAETPVAESAPAKKEGEEITSPMVGTFYEAPSPDSPAYAKVGTKIKKGDTLCILEAMKIMNELEAEFDCEIIEILVNDGQAIEYDTPLFLVKRV